MDLDAVLLVGFPFPDVRDPWIRRKAGLIKDMGYNGYVHAYLFTAVSSAVQAVGRVMRGLDERAKYVAAVDDRFWRYRHYMPAWFTKGAVLRDSPAA